MISLIRRYQRWRGKRYFKKGHPELALEWFEKASDLQGVVSTGEYYLSVGMYDHAINAFKNNPDRLVEISDVCLRKAEIKLAYKSLELAGCSEKLKDFSVHKETEPCGACTGSGKKPYSPSYFLTGDSNLDQYQGYMDKEAWENADEPCSVCGGKGSIERTVFNYHAARK